MSELKVIPKSLSDAIDENPERFVEYLEIDAIVNSPNPYREFLVQFKRAFGSTRGISLYKYIKNRYNIPNKLYKSESLQKRLPIKFKGALKRKETQKFFQEVEVEKRITKRRLPIKKTILTSSYLREGKRISTHKRSRPLDYTKRQEIFIKQRQTLPLKQLTKEYNNIFNTRRTSIGLRDKRLRLLGKKK